MNIESLTLEVRPRTPWESMDLSVRLVIAHWRILLSAWMVSIFPLFLVINLILLKDYPYWAMFLIWFLKPLYDRVPLFVLSRVIFAEQTTWKNVLNAIPSLFNTGIISSLSLYRLDPARAFALPVRQLEGLKGKRRRQRMNALNRSVNNREVLLFLLCVHLELLFTWGLMVMVFLMLPNTIAMQGVEGFLAQTEPGFLMNALSMILYFMIMMVVETLYVAGGFVLYLNRRIILEGWDIELVFRKLAQRQQEEKNKVGNSFPKQASLSLNGMMIFLISSLFFTFSVTMPQNSQAGLQPSTTGYEKILPPLASETLQAEQSEKIIQEVMQDPAFNRFKKVKKLEYIGKNDAQDNTDQSRTQTRLTEIFEVIGNTIAFIFEIGIWLLALVVIFLLVKYRERLNLGFFQKKSKIAVDVPEMLFGLDLSEESLPDDVTVQALLLYQKGEPRAALALLYRASLAYLVKHYDFNLAKGATEGDCLYLVTEKLALPSAAEKKYFIELTQAWQLTAYAHKTIPLTQMQQLCLHWSLYYAPDNTLHDVAKKSGSGVNE